METRYQVTIEFVSDYLQAKFGDEAKEQVSKTVKKSTTDDPIKANNPDDFIYQNKNGCFIPAAHFEGALQNSGKDFKVKNRRCSYKDFIKAKVFVEPEQIPFGKKTYDNTLLSYVKRKDGSRVPIIHPVFKKGTQITFEILCLEDPGEDLVKQILENAGASYAVGARRPKWGRFKVTEFNKVK